MSTRLFAKVVRGVLKNVLHRTLRHYALVVKIPVIIPNVIVPHLYILVLVNLVQVVRMLQVQEEW